ncbi:hypothetical protein C2S52_007780 [Perilla frutescens var. hirtella]|nr:hypothetical protein C2S52_007780 [Perilla frutescens var. hirtella]
MTNALEAFGVACSRSDDKGSKVENAKLLAHQEDSNGNYLHFPTTLGVMNNDLKYFQWHLRKVGTENFKETISIHQFCNGYVKGLYDSEGRRKILKLENWPPGESLHEQLPRHYLEFVRFLPFMLYTHPRAGHLNMSTRIPIVSRKLDMGPKMSITYGVGQELGIQNRQIKPTLLYHDFKNWKNLPIILLPNLQKSPKKRAKIAHGSSPKYASSSCTISSDEEAELSHSKVAEFKEPECGAISDIFKRRDVPKLDEYLRKHAGELKHISLLHQVNLVHPVHERAFYLTLPHKRNFKEEYGVEPWTIVQKLRDAVFVPVGCPHQIRNHMKVPRVDSDVQ